MSNSFSVTKKQPKTVRLVGSLLVNVNGTEVEVSNAFRIQTDLSFSGMSQAEQETVMSAVQTALAGNADISFTAKLNAEEVKSNKAKSKEPSLIDILLADANKPKPEEIEAAVSQDKVAKQESLNAAQAILGCAIIPQSKGVL